MLYVIHKPQIVEMSKVTTLIDKNAIVLKETVNDFNKTIIKNLIELS